MSVERGDSGLLKYGAGSLGNGFSDQYNSATFLADTTKQVNASYRITANLVYPGSESSGLDPFRSHNPFGLYATQIALVKAPDTVANPSTAYLATLSPVNPHGMWYSVAEVLSVLGESAFVHEAGHPTDPAHRITYYSSSDFRRWVRFDREDYFNSFIVPILNDLVARASAASPLARPAILWDNFPADRSFGFPSPALSAGGNWDYFTTDDEYFAAVRTLAGRIKSKYPTLLIWGNWVSQAQDESGDRAMDIIDGIFFESDGGATYRQQQLAVAWRAGKAGKAVVFGSGTHSGTVPTLDSAGLRSYFSVYLTTLAEGHRFAISYYASGDSMPGVVTLAEMERWIGPPIGEMFEVRPRLWCRNFANGQAFVNVSDQTYVIPVQGGQTVAGTVVTSLTLNAGQGDFVFRHSPASAVVSSSAFLRQAPDMQAAEEYRRQCLEFDMIRGSMGLGFGASAMNAVPVSDDVTAGSVWTQNASTTVTRGAAQMWNGLQMNDVSDETTGVVMRAVAVYSGSLANKWVTLSFYAAKIDPRVDALLLAIDGLAFFTTEPVLLDGPPKRYVVQMQIPSGYAGVVGLVIRTVTSLVVGKFRIGAIRVHISDSADDPAAISEHIQTSSVALTRGVGTGIGAPLTLLSVGGYTRSDGARPVVPLTGHTQLANLSATAGATAGRPTLGSSDAGVQYFDTTLGIPIWWNGSGWKNASGTSV